MLVLYSYGSYNTEGKVSLDRNSTEQLQRRQLAFQAKVGFPADAFGASDGFQQRLCQM